MIHQMTSLNQHISRGGGREMRNACRILVEKLKGRHHCGYLGMVGRIILKRP
jgi:hypothetical protein